LTILNRGIGQSIYVLGTLTLSHITISDTRETPLLNLGGTLIIKDSVISGTGGHATAVIENHGALTVQNTSFFKNGASAILSEDGPVEVTNCIFSGNLSYAGTIWSASSLSVKDSVFSHNGTEGSGGAINSGGTLDIRNSTFFGNTAMFGGGAIAAGGDVRIDGTLLVGNTAGGSPSSRGFGGGIAFGGGPLTINHSFILDNKANTNGGGIYVWAGAPPTLNHTTVTNNTPNDVAFQP
jgi:predicted outer membrane repeat protein/parallel beta-helix repeat protein